MLARDGRYFQRRSQKGYRGAETNVEEKQIDYAVGSGNHARTYLHLTARNMLQELPLGWYAEKGGSWGMSPGYDRPDQLYSRRRVSYECMACHNAYPRIPGANRAFGSDPVFSLPLPEGLDCQRCHGPGQRHVTLASSAGKRAQEIRAAIVNPARLDAARQMEVCLQCHLETTSSPLPHAIVRYDRAPFSYRPGQPLADFALFFQAALEPGRTADQNDRFEIADTAVRLRKSACFLKSAGNSGGNSESRLQCTTCHDPHDVPRGPQAAAHYNAVCRQCHSGAFDRLVSEGKHKSAGNCIDCHMPKRRTDDTVHVVMTDHYIRRQPPSRNLLAPLTESGVEAHSEVRPYYPDPLPGTPDNQLYVAVAQVRDRSNLTAGVAQLKELVARYRPERAEFYFELAGALLATKQPESAVANYDEAVRRDPNSLPLRKGFASALLETGQLAKAEATLRSATERWPDDPELWSMFAELQLKSEKNEAALTALRKALALDSEMPDVWNSVGTVLGQTGDAAGAAKAFSEAARIQPNLAEAYANLGTLSSPARPPIA
jgi:predicted CXXCH cytochrome family protein